MSQHNISSPLDGNRLDAFAWIQGGDRLLKEKKFSEAVEVYSEAVKMQPNSASHLSKLGNALLRQKLYERAEQCFRQALTLNAKSHLGLYGLGQSLAGLEQWEEAITV